MKKGRKLFPWILSGILLLGGGCGHVLSKEALVAADPDLTIAQLMADPKAYQGSTLLLGGPIIETEVGREGSTLEILNYTLTGTGEPRHPQEGDGRFLAKTDRFLDPEIFRKGRFVTLTGTFLGTESRPLGKTEHIYPVFSIGEAYLWSPPLRHYEYYPGFYGPGYPWGSYYHRYPYRGYGWGPYDPFWDPFWYDPFYYPGYRFR